MYKAIKDNKIIAISEKKEVIIHTEDGDIVQEVTGEALFPSLVFDEVIEDTEHTVDDYKRYDDEFMLHNIEKDNEEMKQARANAYAVEVDTIMSEYNRKKTFNLFEEGEEEELMKVIQDKVAEIKARYPYSEVE